MNGGKTVVKKPISKNDRAALLSELKSLKAKIEDIESALAGEHQVIRKCKVPDLEELTSEEKTLWRQIYKADKSESENIAWRKKDHNIAHVVKSVLKRKLEEGDTSFDASIYGITKTEIEEIKKMVLEEAKSQGNEMVERILSEVKEFNKNEEYHESKRKAAHKLINSCNNLEYIKKETGLDEDEIKGIALEIFNYNTAQGWGSTSLIKEFGLDEYMGIKKPKPKKENLVEEIMGPAVTANEIIGRQKVRERIKQGK
ncbi:hypothetical protein JXB01_01495, partial [Candidatus Micrarchaeota archaeon]|nr:hypothetical protein [Candidatus Micrarchaeota archaeon]